MATPVIILASPAADLTGLAVSRILASDEAREAAERMAGQTGDPPVTLTKALRPWDPDGIHSKEYFLANPDEAPLDGESFVGFQARVLKVMAPLLREAEEKQESVAILVDDTARRLIDGWVRAGAGDDGAVDIEAFSGEAPPCISALVLSGRTWNLTSEVALRGSTDEKEPDMSHDPFASILGEVVGFDWQQTLSNLAQTAEGIKKSVDEDKAKEKAKQDMQAALRRSVDADAAWAGAETHLILAATVPAHAASQVARDAAAADAMRAGSGLDADSLSKRCEAAQKALKDAAGAASASPNDAVKQARMQAWQKVASQCNLQYVPDGKGGERLAKRGGSFLDVMTRRYAGIPTWGWGLITVGALTALILIIRSLSKRKAGS